MPYTIGGFYHSGRKVTAKVILYITSVYSELTDLFLKVILAFYYPLYSKKINT